MKGRAANFSIAMLITASASAGLAYPIDDAERAEAAYARKDYGAFLKDAETTAAGAPADPSSYYLLARALTLNGRPAEAIKALGKATELGGTEMDGLAGDKDFQSLSGRGDFIALLARIDQLKKPVRNSQAVYRLTEPKLVPEGTAYDPVTRTLFLSSVFKRKIVAIDADGAVRDFIPEKAEGIWAVAGMEVDPARRHLWVASAAGMQPGFIKDPGPDDAHKTGIFQFDVDTGKLIAKYVRTDPNSFFNDLTVTRSGDVYVTDTGLGAVWKIAAAAPRLQMFIEPSPATRRFHNGIAMAPGDRRMFVAHAFGIDLVDLATRQSVPIGHPANVTLGSIDGLSFYKDSLIAHQGASIGSINRYHLSPDWTRVVRREIIDSRLPEFEQATTGAVAGDDYYYIANSQIRRLNPNNPRAAEPFNDVIILKSSLAGDRP